MYKARRISSNCCSSARHRSCLWAISSPTYLICCSSVSNCLPSVKIKQVAGSALSRKANSSRRCWRVLTSADRPGWSRSAFPTQHSVAEAYSGEPLSGSAGTSSLCAYPISAGGHMPASVLAGVSGGCRSRGHERQFWERSGSSCSPSPRNSCQERLAPAESILLLLKTTCTGTIFL